jgi:lysophospholipase L1-like esterase
VVRQFFLITLVTFLLLVLGCSGDGDNKENMPPSADAGTDQTVEEKSLVSLSGSGTDSDGTVESYLWSQWSGPATNLNNKDTAHATFTAPEVTEETILTFRLTVTDNGGASDSDDVTVKVNPVNLPPSADAGSDGFVPGQTLVTLSGSGSDGDGNNDVTYAWTQVEGTEVTINNADRESASFTAPDVTERLTFRLTVTDNEGATASDDVTISVASILFSDDFDDGNSYGWTVFDNSGYSSYWLVVGGEYVQWNVVEGIGSFDQSYHLGTCSYINSGSDWTNYRLMVEVTPLPNNPEDDARTQGNDVGVIFRRQDNDNYYRLTLNSRYGFTRLEKKVDGVFSTLAVDSAGYYEGEALNITIEVNGSLIQVFVDDEPLFGVLDPDPIDSGSIALYCQDKAKFDDVFVMENSPAPAITVSSPVAYSIETTDIFDVSAIATNVPQDGSIKFILDNDDMTSVVDSDFPYTAQFTGVSQDEHILDAILRDDSGSEIARDSNVQIGRGDYYVAVGDSITNGVGDDDSSDNTSEDGRIIGIQGYGANLNDLLTSTLGYPHIVFNEGIGGDKSYEALNERINSILERHPESNKVLILLGTNDVGNEVTSNTFQQNMQALVDTVDVAEKTAWVGFIPPFFLEDGTPDTEKNPIVNQLNLVIDGLDNVEFGPDFYAYFLGSGTNRSSLFVDTVHPNGLGHAVMAHLWHNALIPGSPVQLPLVVDDLDRPTYKQNLLEVGDEYYIDATSFTLSDIPTELDGGTWIMTANADRTNSSLGFLSFRVDRDVTVYAAYDSGAVLPDWLLTSFADTGVEIGTTNGALHLYGRDYASGSTVELDGNRAGGGTGASNYIVIVAEK